MALIVDNSSYIHRAIETTNKVSSFEELKVGEGIYTVKDIAAILKIDRRKARYLLTNYLNGSISGAKKFVYNFHQEVGIFVNFKSLLQILVFKELKDRGFNKATIMVAYSTISVYYNTLYPFADQIDKIISAGNQILFRDKNGRLIGANEKLQFAMDEILSPLFKKLDFDNNGSALRYYPLGKKSNVVVDPTIQFGSPVISGTRINVDTIYNLHLAGDSEEIISDLYGLSNAQIKDAIAYSIAA